MQPVVPGTVETEDEVAGSLEHPGRPAWVRWHRETPHTHTKEPKKL